MENTDKAQTRWAYWKKTSISTAKPLLYLIVCYSFINNRSTYDTPWFLRGNFWLVYFAIIFITTAIMTNLAGWYDEELPDEHIHIPGPRYNMTRQRGTGTGAGTGTNSCASC
ncbi:hypothetical protein F5Y03DRAFT_375165 [Xylaria venustula]|nr:hypothetical protein F5Y03DRAFT_375165 [Xylaria venustula]